MESIHKRKGLNTESITSSSSGDDVKYLAGIYNKHIKEEIPLPVEVNKNMNVYW